MIERPTVSKSVYHVGDEIGDEYICPDCGWVMFEDCPTCVADHAEFHRELGLAD